MIRLRILLLSVLASLALPAGVALADGGSIMSLSDVKAGMDCTGETVVQGTTISSFAVHVVDVVESPGEGARILVTVSGPAVQSTGIAEGFSGSPVYCPNRFGGAANIGAISESVGEYGNDAALVTPIEQMLGESVYPPSSAPRLVARRTPLLGPLTIGGLSPALLGLVQQAGHRAGRLILDAPSAPALIFPVQALVPGASVAVGYSSGALQMGAVGTVTYTRGQTIYAFGHELDGAGRRSLLLQDAYVYYVVRNPDPIFPSYKLAAPGHTVGTLTSDTPNAVIGEVGNGPPLVPVDVTAHDLDTGHALELDSQVADETDIGLPLGSSLVDMVAPLEVAQAATQVYDGAPAGESGSMCLQVYLRGRRRPLAFCNRYVGDGQAGDAGLQPPEVANGASNDVTNAFTLLEQEQFATLDVTRVTAQIQAERGLAEARIIGVRAPRRVRAGHTVRVRLRLRTFRGALRTVDFSLRVPRAARGLYVGMLRGPRWSPTPPPSSLGGFLSFGLSNEPFPTSQPTPSSISALRRAFAAIGTYDGLYLGGPGHPRRRVYRDPRLLITGHALLTFRVAR